jgi:hypothetical protein
MLTIQYPAYTKKAPHKWWHFFGGAKGKYYELINNILTWLQGNSIKIPELRPV